MAIDLSKLTVASIRLRVADRDEVLPLKQADLIQFVGYFNDGQLTSGEPYAYLCFFQPELFVNLESADTTYEFCFCLDCDAVKITHRGRMSRTQRLRLEEEVHQRAGFEVFRLQKPDCPKRSAAGVASIWLLGEGLEQPLQSRPDLQKSQVSSL